jgi:aminoacylase
MMAATFRRFCACLLLLFPIVMPSSASLAIDAVHNFREYLRIKTVHPKPDYEAAKNFLQDYGKNLSLNVEVFEYVKGDPVVLMTWEGSSPESESILANSHMDVVPVEQGKWRHDAFEAVREPSGDIVARGSQDMKCVGIQYLEAIRKLQAKGFKPERSIHVLFVPDEEIGGHDGMEQFIASEKFLDLKVGVALDEGLASPTPEYRVFYGERTLWWLTIKAVGAPGHGSKLFDGSAAENLLKSLALISAYREEEFNAFKSGEAAEAEVTSINLSFLKAGTPSPTGFVMNLQPSEVEAGFDIRIPPTADFDELERRIREEWAPEARNMTFEFKQKNLYRSVSGEPLVTSYDESNPWWAVFSSAVEKTGVKLRKPEIFPAATDGRYLRIQDFPVIGFSPMRETPILLHDHNEFLNEGVFLEGIDVYENVLAALSMFDGASGPSYVLREEL